MEKLILQPVVADYSVSDPQFRQSISNLLGPPLLDGNKVETLLNGDKIFPAMLEAIRNAKKSITLETYIWANGGLSEDLARALIERSLAGVKVNVIVDALGSYKLPVYRIKNMKAAGVRFVEYGHPHWFNLFFWINHRTHRKILVVDGLIGFTGGVGFHDNWLKNAEAAPYWRDTQFRIEGPAVAELQGVFMDNWVRTRNRVLHGEDYFPLQKKAGTMAVQFFKSGPRDGAENARMNYLVSIAAAKHNIRLSHAYFMPDKLATRALIDACKRGVRVEVIVPGRIDSRFAKAASRAKWDDLLKAGVEFYEYQPTLFHCKVMIVDDIWVTAGSVNFDNRSFRINAENSINVLDKTFATQQIQIFETDKTNSQPLTLEQFKKRHIGKKIMERIANLFRHQL